MSSSAGGWRPPLCDSRTGAAHIRRGAPCQDASGVWSFVEAGRQPVQLLVVSDGHGGSRYDRSEVGSWLACEVALQEARERFACFAAETAPPQDDWRQWLGVDLPRRIVEHWRRRVLAHAKAHPRADGAEPSTIPYGATLGLLLLTPRWWGCTGLGDWDLVRLDAEGRGELISEEPDGGGGEATYSLCMPGAERYFAARSSLQPISPEAPPFSLLLSSDGIRKSCGSDADFLTLAHYLCGLEPTGWDPQPSELSAALDHISSEGSGDDVSVAIGRWGLLSASDRRPIDRVGGGPLIVPPQWARPPEPQDAAATASPQVREPWMQPSPDAPPGLPADAPAVNGHQGRLSPWLVGTVAAGLLLAAGAAAFWLGLGPLARRQPGPEAMVHPLSSSQLAVLRLEAQRLCAGASSAAAATPAAASQLQPGSASGSGQEPRSDRSSASGTGAPAAVASSSAGVGSSPAARPSAPAAVTSSSSPATAPPHPAAASGALVAPPSGPSVANGPAVPLDAARLALISASLNQHQHLFGDLAQGRRSPAQLLIDPQRDPLSGLIAWSALQQGLGPPLVAPAAARPGSHWLPAGLTAWLQGRLGRVETPSQPPSAVPLCPELRQALRQQWQALPSETHSLGASPHAPVPGPPVPPPADANPAGPGGAATAGGQR